MLSIGLLHVGYSNSAGRHMTFLDSIYFTTETLTTVGFGDFYFADQPGWLRVWAIVLMVIGATVVTVLYAMLTNLLVSRRIAQSLGRQLATRMNDHVILVGLGSVGLRVLELLRSCRATGRRARARRGQQIPCPSARARRPGRVRRLDGSGKP